MWIVVIYYNDGSHEHVRCYDCSDACRLAENIVQDRGSDNIKEIRIERTK